MRARRCTPNDREVLILLQQACLPHDEPIEPEGLWWVIADAAGPWAFCAAKPTRGDAATWYLSRAGVVPEARGRGLQKRMIRLRERAARRAGARWMVTDCTMDNAASANSLIACGYRLYTPSYRWALPTSLYWRKRLCP